MASTDSLLPALGHEASAARLFPAPLLIHGPGEYSPDSQLQVFGLDTPEQIKKHRDHTGPPRLVAGAEPRSVVTMEVFMEEDQIAPVRIVLELGGPSVNRPPSVGVAQERTGQSAGDFTGHFEQRQVPPRAGRTLNLEFIAVEAIQVQERADEQRIDGHPHGAAPVGIAPEHSGI